MPKLKLYLVSLLCCEMACGGALLRQARAAEQPQPSHPGAEHRDEENAFKRVKQSFWACTPKQEFWGEYKKKQRT